MPLRSTLESGENVFNSFRNIDAFHYLPIFDSRHILTTSHMGCKTHFIELS